MPAVRDDDIPVELKPGNIVRLKRPHQSSDDLRRRADWADPENDPLAFTHGVIVQVLYRAPGGRHGRGGVWRLSLHLYNPRSGRLHVSRDSVIPTYFDMGADELLLVKVGRHVGYRELDHDLYPPCPACGGAGGHLDTRDGCCPTCAGLGVVFAPLPPGERPATSSGG